MAKEVLAEKLVKDIRRQTRRRFTAEEKIRIVLGGLRSEESVTALCRCEGIAANLYYRWSKEFLEAGKKQLLGDTKREATSSEVSELRRENSRLKELVAETLLENRVLKKSVTGCASEENDARHTAAEKLDRGRSRASSSTTTTAATTSRSTT